MTSTSDVEFSVGSAWGIVMDCDCDCDCDGDCDCECDCERDCERDWGCGGSLPTSMVNEDRDWCDTASM
jgi:hypothetical protein